MKSQRVYWTTTGIIAFVMLFSMYKMFSPLWAHLGFPTYLRAELIVAKLIGLVVLVVPGVPVRLKEWAYAGFAIVLVSASLAHLESGDGAWHALEPLGFLGVLIVSNLTLARPARG